MTTISMTTIPITQIMRRSDADKFRAAIQGKTWMDFQVTVAPAGGGWEVAVSTSHAAPQDATEAEALEVKAEIMGTLLSLLLRALAASAEPA